MIDACDVFNTPANWPTAWFIFAGYALVVAILFAILFKYKHEPQQAQA